MKQTRLSDDHVMQWFISGYLEKEERSKLIVDQSKRAGDSESALLLLDRKLGARSMGKHEGDAE